MVIKETEGMVFLSNGTAVGSGKPLHIFLHVCMYFLK